jgi:hypothetical protein
MCVISSHDIVKLPPESFAVIDPGMVSPRIYPMTCAKNDRPSEVTIPFFIVATYPRETRSTYLEPIVSVGGDSAALRLIAREAADIREKYAWFSRNIGTDVP